MLLKTIKLKELIFLKFYTNHNVSESTPIKKTLLQDHNLEDVIDFKILKEAKLAIEKKVKMSLIYNIKNTDRTVGTILSNEISKLYGAKAFLKILSNLISMEQQVKALVHLLHMDYQ